MSIGHVVGADEAAGQISELLLKASPYVPYSAEARRFRKRIDYHRVVAIAKDAGQKEANQRNGGASTSATKKKVSKPSAKGGTSTPATKPAEKAS